MSKIEKNIQKLHQASYYQNCSEPDEARKEAFPQYLAQPKEGAALIQLPDVEDFVPSNNDFVKLLKQRRTERQYDTQALMSQQELSYLLKYTQGLREFNEKRGVSLRYVPSAGSRHPYETYLLIQRVEGIEPGIYHFIAHKNALELISLDQEMINKAHESTLKQRQVITSAVTFFWSAEVYRTSWRYNERAYRFLNLDGGHICQNLYLCAESIGYGVCAIAAFDDQLANELLDQDGLNRFVLYIASVGKKFLE
ncbi:MAG: SagB/ThcOx family dehydrogenase [Anaerolineaceae bacterium]|jgi:SagB-type dehydrogenase family enzyme